MSNAVKPDNYRTCVCGKECKGRAAMANHARTCPDETARATAFIARIEAGTPATIVPVPNKPKTPISSFRIPTELKAEAKVAANDLGTDLTAIVIKAFEDAVKKAKKQRAAK